VTIPLRGVVAALIGGDVSPAWRTIVVDVRLPRAITATLAGAALGISGLSMQTLFRNPLADPFVLGVSSGASLGVAIVVLATGAGASRLLSGLGWFGHLGVAGAAAVGAALVMALVLAASRRIRSVATILIIGLMVGYAASAIVSLLVHVGVGGTERLRAFLQWGLGSFRGTTWSELRVFTPIVLLTLLSTVALVKPLNALLIGDRYAASMGVAVRRARTAILAAASILAGAVTAFCGPIAFLGVAIPHLARSVLGTSDHRVLVPAVALLGGSIALIAELIAQTPGTDTVLPLNAITSLLGAPVIVLVLVRMRRATHEVAA